MVIPTINVTEDAILSALRTWLLSILPSDREVIQGQVNRVPEPTATNFIVMVPVNRARLSTNIEQWDETTPNPTQIQEERDTQLSIQLDIHGDGGSDDAQIIATLWRSIIGCDAFDIFQPLYASDGHQVPFINDQKQFENRWIMTLELQADIIVSTDYEFADTLDAAIDTIGSPNP